MYNSNNVFFQIINGKLPCKKIYEDDDILSFEDINKVAPVHVLVVPKSNFTDYDDFVLNEDSVKVANFFKKIAQIARKLELKDNSYRLITNKGLRSAQSVEHFHVHIIGGKQLNGLI